MQALMINAKNCILNDVQNHLNVLSKLNRDIESNFRGATVIVTANVCKVDFLGTHRRFTIPQRCTQTERFADWCLGRVSRVSELAFRSVRKYS